MLGEVASHHAIRHRWRRMTIGPDPDLNQRSESGRLGEFRCILFSFS